MLYKKLKILIIFSLFCNVKPDEKSEYLCNIISKKPINFVSDKFLSISVDPAVLIAGMNLR